jgi:hypothetical protein
MKFGDVLVGQRFGWKGREMLRAGYQLWRREVQPLYNIECAPPPGGVTAGTFAATAVDLANGLLEHVWPDEEVTPC